MSASISLGDRMKEFYENRAETYLTRRTPVIVRIDGRAFHSFTKGFKRPFDEVFHNSMNQTCKYLCDNIQGCKLAYTQSDEISLLLVDYDTHETAAFFDYRVQKLCSIIASMATLAFNQQFRTNVNIYGQGRIMDDYIKKLFAARDKGAMFDARCFNIPENEITNYFIFRQQDATRNAIQMLGQTHFSHKELNRKSCNDIQDMLFREKGINFNDLPIEYKRGICVKKIDGNWVIDKEIPIFTQERDYIEEVIPKEAEAE